MSHVGVQRLGPGDAQKYAAEHQKSLQSAARQIVEAVTRIDGRKDRRVLQDAMDAERRDRRKPEQHDRTERATDRGRPEWLRRKQRQQDRGRRGQHIGLQARRDLLHAFERREHRNRRRDRAVAVNERRAEQANRDDQRPLTLLDAEQGHQRDDAAFAVVVDPHGDIDVLDRRDEEQRPQDQRQGAERGRRIGVRPGVVEHSLQRIEGARPDVPEHHAERREAHEPESSDRLRFGAGGFGRHPALPRSPLGRRARGRPEVRR